MRKRTGIRATESASDGSALPGPQARGAGTARLGCVALASILLGCAGEGPGAYDESDGDQAIVQAQICPPWGCPPLPHVLVQNVTPTSIASDGNTVYFTNNSDLLGPKIVKVPAAGGIVVTLLSGKPNPVSIGVHGSGLYWAEWGPSATAGTGVWSMATSGGAAKKLFGAANDVNQTQSLAVASATSGIGVDLYWANAFTSQLYDVYLAFFGVPPATTALLPVPMGTSYYPRAVAFDSVSLYFTSDASAHPVYRAPRAGGAPTLLDTGAEYASIATDGNSVFYVKSGAIKKKPVGGGAAVTFASTGGTVSAMVVRSGTLYWACSSCGTIMKQAIAAGGATTLASGQASPSCIAVDDARVYWGTTTALKSIPK